MRPNITEDERMVINHALMAEHDRVKGAHGNGYGPLALEELKALAERLLTEEDPIEVYLYKEHCPVCKVHLCVNDGVRYCSNCDREWDGDKVLKEFY